jgi:hypothetical protein
MQAGLPVFGVVNSGNDLIELVKDYQVGHITDEIEDKALSSAAMQFLEDMQATFPEMRSSCKSLCINLFSSAVAAHQISSITEAK